METMSKEHLMPQISIVLILPMRNGNEFFFDTKTPKAPRSYPTYEEWKLNKNMDLSKSVSCSYPTYEEWKLRYKSSLHQTRSSSYPTYEEWKPPS